MFHKLIELNTLTLTCIIKYDLDREAKLNPVIGDIVKVFSPSLQSFYRAKIISITDNVNFNVFYIDFGNSELVKLSDIFKLSNELKVEVYNNT